MDCIECRRHGESVARKYQSRRQAAAQAAVLERRPGARSRTESHTQIGFNNIYRTAWAPGAVAPGPAFPGNAGNDDRR